MRRFFIVLIIGLGMFAPDLLGRDAEIDLSEQAGRMIEHLVLKSGLGIRWEPSPGEVKPLRAAVDRPWEELKPLKAPFARSDGEIVTTEALAWTILAEIAYARRLAARNSPEALVYLYLASLQVGFAREELLDPEPGLYRPEWRDGEAYGEPALRDQLLMLWALSRYSAIGDLLASEEEVKPENIRLFRRRIGPLADELFRALQPGLAEAELSDRDRLLREEALGAYRDATRDSELAREAEGYAGSPGFAPSPRPTPMGDAYTSSLRLETLADRLASDAFANPEALWKDPAVRRLVGGGVPWPASVAYDAASGEWRVEDPTLETAGAMAVAYRLLTLRSPSPVTSEPSRASDAAFARLAQQIARLNEELIAREEQLTSLSEPQAEGNPPGGTEEAPSSAAPYALTLWEALVLGATVLVSVGAVLFARREAPRS